MTACSYRKDTSCLQGMDDNLHCSNRSLFYGRHNSVLNWMKVCSLISWLLYLYNLYPILVHFLKILQLICSFLKNCVYQHHMSFLIFFFINVYKEMIKFVDLLYLNRCPFYIVLSPAAVPLHAYPKKTSYYNGCTISCIHLSSWKAKRRSIFFHTWWMGSCNRVVLTQEWEQKKENKHLRRVIIFNGLLAI